MVSAQSLLLSAGSPPPRLKADRWWSDSDELWPQSVFTYFPSGRPEVVSQSVIRSQTEWSQTKQLTDGTDQRWFIIFFNKSVLNTKSLPFTVWSVFFDDRQQTGRNIHLITFQEEWSVVSKSSESVAAVFWPCLRIVHIETLSAV